MIAEAITKLRSIIDEAARPIVLEHKNLPLSQTLVAFKGELKSYARERADLDEQLFDLPSFLSALSSYDLDLGDVGEGLKSTRTIYVGASEVVCVYGAGRHDRSSMQLQQTDRFVLLGGLSGREFTPAEAVSLIRFDLHGIGADSLLAALRKVNFEQKAVGASEIRHGRESLGKSVDASVTAEAAVPDQFTAVVQVFRNGGLRDIVASVKIGVYLDVTKQRVRLLPLTDEYKSAFDTALDLVERKIEGSVEDAPYEAVTMLGNPE